MFNSLEKRLSYINCSDHRTLRIESELYVRECQFKRPFSFYKNYGQSQKHSQRWILPALLPQYTLDSVDMEAALFTHTQIIKQISEGRCRLAEFYLRYKNGKRQCGQQSSQRFQNYQSSGSNGAKSWGGGSSRNSSSRGSRCGGGRCCR